MDPSSLLINPRPPSRAARPEAPDVYLFSQHYETASLPHLESIELLTSISSRSASLRRPISSRRCRRRPFSAASLEWRSRSRSNSSVRASSRRCSASISADTCQSLKPRARAGGRGGVSYNQGQQQNNSSCVKSALKAPSKADASAPREHDERTARSAPHLSEPAAAGAGPTTTGAVVTEVAVHASRVPITGKGMGR